MRGYAGVVGVLWVCAAPHAQGQDALAAARSALDRRQVDSAYQLIQRAVREAPSSAEARYWLGEIAGRKAASGGLLGAIGPARRSKAGYARAVELQPDNPVYLEGLANYLYQAPGIMGGDRDSALALAARVEELDRPRGVLLLAAILWRGGGLDRVRADSIVGAFYLDADRSVRRRIGQYWALTGRDEHAVPVFERLVREDSLDAVARYFLGRSLVMLAREPRRAQEHLAYAAGISDSGREREYDIEQALWRLGQAYRQLGVLDSARVNFERALYQRPGYRPARRSLDSLRLR